MRTLEGTGRLFDVWRIPRRFTKNPDLIRFPSGKLMLVFCDCDKHWPEESSRITTLESSDGGATWGNPRVVAEALIGQGEERWLTPRLSLLRSGRLVIVCDHDDYTYYHIDRPSGVWIWFSDDAGATWSEPRHTTIPGIEPDRVVELADGALITTTEVVLKDNWRLAMLASRSRDGGLTWDPPSAVAKDPGHDYNEGAVVVLSNGALACVMREENHNGYPSCVAFSYDLGRTWSGVRPLPFSGDRPYAKELRDGRVLVTYRNQAGNRGTHAWVGDLTAAAYQVAGVHYGDEVRLDARRPAHRQPPARRHPLPAAAAGEPAQRHPAGGAAAGGRSARRAAGHAAREPGVVSRAGAARRHLVRLPAPPGEQRQSRLPQLHQRPAGGRGASRWT